MKVKWIRERSHACLRLFPAVYELEYLVILKAAEMKAGMSTFLPLLPSLRSLSFRLPFTTHSFLSLRLLTPKRLTRKWRNWMSKWMQRKRERRKERIIPEETKRVSDWSECMNKGTNECRNESRNGWMSSLPLSTFPPSFLPILTSHAGFISVEITSRRLGERMRKGNEYVNNWVNVWTKAGT